MIAPTEEQLKAVRREPKWKAVNRLKVDGREDAFRKRQAVLRKENSLSRDEAFYWALIEFQPLP